MTVFVPTSAPLRVCSQVSGPLLLVAPRLARAYPRTERLPIKAKPLRGGAPLRCVALHSAARQP